MKLIVNGGQLIIQEALEGSVTSPGSIAVGIHHIVMVHEDDDTFRR